MPSRRRRLVLGEDRRRDGNGVLRAQEETAPEGAASGWAGRVLARRGPWAQAEVVHQGMANLPGRRALDRRDETDRRHGVVHVGSISSRSAYRTR